MSLYSAALLGLYLISDLPAPKHHVQVNLHIGQTVCSCLKANSFWPEYAALWFICSKSVYVRLNTKKIVTGKQW